MRARRAPLAGLFIALALCARADDLPPGILELEPRPAPALRLEDMDGNDFALSEERGTWTFVHFWASWCTPCRREMPRIQAMSERLGDLPLAIVLVNTAETEDTVFTFLAAVAPDLMDTLLDRDGRVTERWQPRGLPSTFLVDPAGRIRYLVLGGREWDAPEYLEFLRGLAQAPRN